MRKPAKPPIPDEFGRFVPRGKVDDALGGPWYKGMKKIDYLKKDIERYGANSGKGKAAARQIEEIQKKLREMGAEVNANPRGARQRAEESIIKKEDWRRAGGKNAPKKAEARMETRARKRRETRNEYGIAKPQTQTKSVRKATPKKAKTTYKGGGGKKTVRDAYNEAKRGKK